MKSVYSAVRTGSLNKAVCTSSLNGYMRRNFTVFTLNNVTHDMSGHAHRGGGSIDSNQSQAGARRRSKVSTILRPFYTQEASVTLLTGGWMGLWAGMDRTENFVPQGYEPRTVQVVTNRYIDLTVIIININVCRLVHKTSTYVHRSVFYSIYLKYF